MTVTTRATEGGEVLYVVEGPSLTDPAKVVNYALRKVDLVSYLKRGQFSMLAQFDTLVADGLILSKHCFNDLRRNLSCDGDPNGNKSKFALSRKPAWDYIWEGGRNGGPKRMVAPTNRVFVILISKNSHIEKFPDIEGWIDRWSWVEEDGGSLAQAPDKWVERYETKVWSRDT